MNATNSIRRDYYTITNTVITSFVMYLLKHFKSLCGVKPLKKNVIIINNVVMKKINQI